jgi:hypothetical protein
MKISAIFFVFKMRKSELTGHSFDLIQTAMLLLGVSANV